MSEFLFFLMGLLVGGCLGTQVVSMMHIERICNYEAQIRKLQMQIAKEQKSGTLNK